jgi:peptidoglycan/xylan/chitin deacetylase (PgdA/CDA1 family)
MSVNRLRAAVAVLGAAAAAFAMITPAASAAVNPPPASRLHEGPPGPPARLPNGRLATPPRVSPMQPAYGCQTAPYGPNYYAPGSGKTVALTFDDGPGAGTSPGIMSVLRSAGVTATFFNIGQNAAAQPSLVRTENDWGYLIGNHTWNHPDLTTLSAAQQGAQMDEATAEQQSLIGSGPCVFRPPYGSYNPATLGLAQQRRMKTWLWSVDTEDWKAGSSSSQYWVNRIISLAESEGGALQNPVILMHNAPSGDPATVKALPTIISYFRGRGYTFVNLQGNTGNGYQVLTSKELQTINTLP